MKIEINSDKNKVEEIRAAVKANNGYCPCQIEKNERTKCICLNFLEDDEEWCHCGLYRKIKD